MEKKSMAATDEKDVLLDHEYDGIRELDNKLPPWWLYLFYISIVFAVIYMIHYHVTGTGDLSHSEYMKEVDPDWQAEKTGLLSSLFYSSPYSKAEDMTPRSRVEMAMGAEAAAKISGTDADLDVTGIGFEDLILAAMDVSTSEDLEKLKSAFPEIWQKRMDQGGMAAAPPAEQAASAVVAYQALTDDASLNAGKTIFTANCATCHGQAGEGGIGPNMTDDYFIHGAGITNTINVINIGVPAKGMISWRGILTEEQILQVASYILTLQGTNPPNPKAPQGEQVAAGN
jgi:mono/diheme cytochrome c family protein